ncbi:MAG: hypothetical protein ACLFVQ_14475 [Chitinispirillaceae bacterium]
MSERCLGTTKSGERCKISSNLVKGYCRLHQNQARQESRKSSEKEHITTKSEPVLRRVPETGLPEYCSSASSFSGKRFFAVAAVITLLFMLFTPKKKKKASKK